MPPSYESGTAGRIVFNDLRGKFPELPRFELISPNRLRSGRVRRITSKRHPGAALKPPISVHRLDHRAGAPACRWRKRGTRNQAIGRSRGGLTSKVHMAVCGLGLPVRFTLTGGQRNDITQAHALIAGLPAEHILADTAYDADHFRDGASAQKAHPLRKNRAKLPRHRNRRRNRNLVAMTVDRT
jgi:transposase